MSKIEEPILRKYWGISPLWIFTLISCLIAGWLIFKSISNAGERIQISFENAQGIQAGRTTIRYHGIEIGLIKKVTLKPDLKSVQAEAEIYPEATKILRENTKFWVVRPKASITEISGLDTLVSGIYIAVQPGEGDSAFSFIAKDDAPFEALHDKGLLIHLAATDLGSLNIGSGVYFKKIKVGEVGSYRLDEALGQVILSVNIKQEYASLVNEDSRFWNVSGISASINSSGVNLNLESLSSLIAGGITFDSPKDGKPVKPLQTFTLFSSINDTERGIKINIALPENHGITNQHAPILYQGLEIGRLNGINFNESYTGTKATANIDPTMEWMLTTGSEFIIEKPQIGLNGVKNASNLVFGNNLSIRPQAGEKSQHFIAQSLNDIIANDPQSLKITLTADNASGIKPNTEVIYRGIKVGFVHSSTLKEKKVDIEIVIFKDHKHLIKSNSRFFSVGGISGQISTEGVEVVVPSFSQMVSPAISFTSEGTNKLKSTYSLYSSEIHAMNAREGVSGVEKITLIATKLPSISVGSPVMYKNFTVGKVEDFYLKNNQIEVKVSIENRYKHLITSNTVFWNKSGIDIKANLSGVEIDTGSMKSILTGGISFGELLGIDNREGNHWKLYSSMSAAQNSGTPISFIAENTDGLSVGSQIRYLGIAVGEVISLTPHFDKHGVKIDATIYPQYSSYFAKEGSYFWVARPLISLTKTENLDSLFGAYISVVPGKGKAKKQFTLHQSAAFEGGLTLILESESRGSISEGTPILFRDIEVGAVTDIKLGRFADRVLIEVKIDDKHRHLVRNNTVFWNRSGLDVSVGLTGATVKSGTIESLIRGGISFATPEGNTLEKQAKSNTHFLLHSQGKPEWSSWRTAIPNY